MPGNALTVAPGSPFGGLKYYGNNFLTRFEGAQVNSPILERLTLVDTPGVLSGEKQRLSRNYDFDQIVRWFAERVDMIVLLFDPFKLDVSDELAAIIKSLAGNEDKIRCVLNKAERHRLRGGVGDEAQALSLQVRAQQGRPDLAAAPHARVRRAHVVARQGARGSPRARATAPPGSRGPASRLRTPSPPPTAPSPPPRGGRAAWPLAE